MVNCKLCDTWGYTYGELQKLAFQDIMHPDDLEATWIRCVGSSPGRLKNIL